MKLAIFGGSTAAGFGVDDRSFAQLVAEDRGLEFVNRAGPSTLITDSLKRVEEARGCEIVLAMHSTGDALVRPTETSLRFMPPRWRRRGWMDPRPYFSRSLRKRIPQQIESAARWRAKVTLIRATGGASLITPAEFEASNRLFIQRLREVGVPTIVMVGSAGVDERFFPKSPDLIAEYDAITRRLAAIERVPYVSFDGVCRHWDDYFGDHLHPTGAGHARLAEKLSGSLAAFEARQRTHAAEQR